MVVREFVQLRPDQVTRAINECPLAYVPLGSLEWHGPHIPLGFDGLKAEALLRRISNEFNRGVFFPTMFWHAFDVMNFPFTIDFPRYNAKKIVNFLYKMGFRIIIMISGHYPPSQVKNLVKAGTWLMKKHEDAYALCIPEHFLLSDLEYIGDHAAADETSLSLELFPDFTKMDEMPRDLSYMERCKQLGIMGKDPIRHASRERGALLVDTFVTRAARVIRKAWGHQSREPIFEVYREAKQVVTQLKKVKHLDDTIKKLGMDSKKDLLRHVAWKWLRGGKQQERNPGDGKR